SQGAYSYLDAAPVNGADQYRLKLEDLNGTVTYSNVITLMYGNGTSIANNISIYPNPSKGVINLSINSANSSASANLPGLQQTTVTPQPLAATNKSSTLYYDIKIISVTGSVIKTATTTQQAWQTDVSDLIPGTYIMEVLNTHDNSIVGKGTFVKL
ncbi:MAG: Cadherin-like beta sandwich domain protein, partial [Mucilaginibacter sp.]|nr:Cadherin-like beta sandwich domain protein [Mucilaginibacter sp.]